MPITFTSRAKMVLYFVATLAELPSYSDGRQYAYYVLETSELYVTYPDMSLQSLSGASQRANTVTKTSDYTITNLDSTVRLDASSNDVTITLPASSDFSGYIFNIKCVDATYMARLETTGGDLLDNVTDYYVFSRHDNLMVQSNGSGWDIL